MSTQALLASGPNIDALRNVFRESKAEVFRLMKQDSYERFKKSTLELIRNPPVHTETAFECDVFE